MARRDEYPICHPGTRTHWANFRPFCPHLGWDHHGAFSSSVGTGFWWPFDCRINSLFGWILGPKHRSRFHRRNVTHRHTVALIPRRSNSCRICHTLKDRDWGKHRFAGDKTRPRVWAAVIWADRGICVWCFVGDHRDLDRYRFFAGRRPGHPRRVCGRPGNFGIQSTGHIAPDGGKVRLTPDIRTRSGLGLEKPKAGSRQRTSTGSSFSEI